MHFQHSKETKMSQTDLSSPTKQKYPILIKPQPIRTKRRREGDEESAGFGADQRDELDRKIFESDEKKIHFEPLSLKGGPEFSLFDSTKIAPKQEVEVEEGFPAKGENVIDDFFAKTCIDEQFIPPVGNESQKLQPKNLLPDIEKFFNHDIFAATRNVFPPTIPTQFDQAFSPESLYEEDDEGKDYYEPPKFQKTAVKLEKKNQPEQFLEYTCSICGKMYAFQSHLVRHARIHSGEKPYECDLCGKHFSESSNLKTHIKRIHSASREFRCHVCGKSFAVNGDLTKHIRVHTREKPFACQICGRRFSDRSNLTQHTRIHAGSKPYECETCHRCYSRRSSLSRHERRVHFEGFLDRHDFSESEDGHSQ